MRTEPTFLRTVALLACSWLVLSGCSRKSDPAADSGAAGEEAAVETGAVAEGGAEAPRLAAPEEKAPAGFPELARIPGEDAAPNTPEAQHAAYVQKRIDELEQFAVDAADEPSALQAIVSELSNRDPLIRAAALEAAIQSGERSVVPKLKEAAAQTDSAEERVAIEEAIEYIELPSLTEVMARRRAAGITTPPKIVAPSTRVARPAVTRPRTTQ